jgi:hypothetical protein
MSRPFAVWRWISLALAAGCATTSGQAARVVAGCDDAVAIDVTVQGSVVVRDHGLVRRTVLRAEQRGDLDRLLFAAGARGWPACEAAADAASCGVRYVGTDGSCRRPPHDVLVGSSGQSLVQLLGDVMEAELGPGRRAQLRL